MVTFDDYVRLKAGAVKSGEVQVYGYHEPIEPGPRCVIR
jgi:hypothetical protein